MTTQSTTLRVAALAAAINYQTLTEALRKSHERNYESLYVGTDGEVYWSESINRSDRQFYRNQPGMVYVERLLIVGTGSCDCNCDYCDEIGKSINVDGKVVSEDDPTFDPAAIITAADAISQAVGDSDVDEYQGQIEEAFAAIQVCYFDDEKED